MVWDLRDREDDTASSNYYARTFFRGPRPKILQTDVHWQSTNGTGVWNYRHIHQLTVPKKSSHLNLVVELWNKDMFSADSLLGAAEVNLHPWILKCYADRMSLKPFEIIKNPNPNPNPR